MARQTGVVIVGAGFAGLSAAQALTSAGVHFIVLEARDRVGGRVESRVNGLGERVDSGGQFLCEDMPELMALVKRRGHTLKESRLDGRFVAMPPVPQAEAEQIHAGATAIRDRLNRLDPADPALAGLTVAGWLDGQPDAEGAKAAFRSMIEGLWCLALDEIPVWYLVSNDRRVTNTVGELQYYVGETMHALAAGLAESLGDALMLGTPVTRIERVPGGARVTSAAGLFTAQAVLVAAPPVVASRIDMVPALPVSLRSALGAWKSGAVIKVQLRYARAFWRARGLSGMVMWREPPGLFAFDTSADDMRPALTFFLGGPQALAMTGLGQDAVRDAAVARLVEALGPEAGEPADVLMRDWTHDRWSGGAYSDVIVDMQATGAEDVIRAGAPPVFFASSELSPSYPGYIEGAIVAGREGACRVLAALQSDSATSASGS